MNSILKPQMHPATRYLCQRSVLTHEARSFEREAAVGKYLGANASAKLSVRSLTILASTTGGMIHGIDFRYPRLDNFEKIMVSRSGRCTVRGEGKSHCILRLG